MHDPPMNADAIPLPAGRVRSVSQCETDWRARNEMNFTELMQLHERHRDDRVAIADALGMTPEQIDAMQTEAMRLANELLEADNAVSVDRAGHENLAR
jgi:hypothetical protein